MDTVLSVSRATEARLLYLENANTSGDYALTYARFAAFVGADKPVTAVSADDVVAFLTIMRSETLPSGERRRPKTIANMHVALGSLWSWLIERGYATNHIMRHVPRPVVQEEPVVPLSADDVVRLLRACERAPMASDPTRMARRATGRRDRAMVALMVETGLRVSELCALNVRDVQIGRNGGTVFVDLGKGNKSRVVPFQRRCGQALHEYLLARSDRPRPADPFFVATRRNVGQRVRRKAVASIISAIGERIGLDVWPHRLRTTALCMMVCNGMSAWEVQRIAGHSNITTTQRYVRAASIDLDDAMRRASPLDSLRL